MAQPEHNPGFALLKETITVSFCEIDDASYAQLDPRGDRYASLKRRSDSEVIKPSRFFGS